MRFMVYTYGATLFEFLVFKKSFAHFRSFSRHLLILGGVPLAGMFLVWGTLALF